MKCHGLCTASEWHVQPLWLCKEYGDHLRQLWFYLFLVGSGCRAQGFCSADLSESAWILPISDHELCWCSHRPVSVQFELGCRSFPSSGHVDMSRLQAGKTEQNSSCFEIDHCIQYGSKPWYLVNPKIACKWMFIPLKMVSIGIDPYPIQYGCVAYLSHPQKSKDGTTKPRCPESSAKKKRTKTLGGIGFSHTLGGT